MSPPSRRPPRPPSDTREAILDAALDLFVEHGFHGTAVPQLAERAGVAAGTIYRHFASKEALVNALYRQLKGEMAAAIMSDLTVDAPARETFRTLWRRQVEYVREHPRAFAFLELHHHPYLDEASCAVEDQILRLTTAIIEPLQQREELKPAPPMLLVSLVLGAFLGMVRASRDGHLELTPENVATAERCCWELIRG